MSPSGAASFRFVQMDVPGTIGIDDGRYLLRASADDEEETVVVVQTFGAPAAARPGRRRRRPRPVDLPEPPAEVPVTRLTVIPADEVSPEAAKEELDSLAGEAETTEAAVAAGLRAANRVLRAQRIATQDPYGHEIARAAPLAVRVGFGTGGELADGQWTRALDIPSPDRRRRRTEALRPQERLAELLAGREVVDVCETLLLRARADVNQGRMREAALQLAAGLEALLTELPHHKGPGQEDDLASLRERRDSIRQTSTDASRGDLAAEQVAEVSETLEICERVLRRRQALRDSG
ncbi:MAG: hypothetical protein ACJ75I_07750 [Solirubrobacterales bacterium]